MKVNEDQNLASDSGESPRPAQARSAYDRRLHEHMARLGAGLQLLKIGRYGNGDGAPITDVISHPDRVTFDFERISYQITRVEGICANDKCPIGATMVGWPHDTALEGCIGNGQQTSALSGDATRNARE